MKDFRKQKNETSKTNTTAGDGCSCGKWWTRKYGVEEGKRTTNMDNKKDFTKLQWQVEMSSETAQEFRDTIFKFALS